MRSSRTTRFVAPLALFVTTLAAESPAQSTPASGQALAERARAALAPLAALVGQWEGDATTSGPGRAKRYRQSEDVVFGAGRTVLMIRGTGRSAEPPNAGDIEFEAAASLWFDADANRIRMRAHRAEGVAVDADVELKPDTLIWGFPVQGGQVRYTLAFDEGNWHEVGHFIREGAPPIQFIDMTLTKVTRAHD